MPQYKLPLQPCDKLLIDQFSNLDLNKTRILGYYSMAKEAHFLSVKYLTGYIQSLAVLTSTKYFTVKKVGSLAIISQNPGFIEIQV